MGLTSVSSSDDDFRYVSNTVLLAGPFKRSQQITCAEREQESTPVKHGAGPFIHKSTDNLLKVSKGGSN